MLASYSSFEFRLSQFASARFISPVRMSCDELSLSES